MKRVHVEIPDGYRLITFDMEAAFKAAEVMGLTDSYEKTEKVRRWFQELQAIVEDLKPGDKIVGCFVAYDSDNPQGQLTQ